jgi:hypothetical protein
MKGEIKKINYKKDIKTTKSTDQTHDPSHMTEIAS